MIIIILFRAYVSAGTQGWIGSRLKVGETCVPWPRVPCTGVNLGRTGVSVGGWLYNSIRCFNSKSTSYLDLCSPIGTYFSKCINICVSYQGP